MARVLEDGNFSERADLLAELPEEASWDAATLRSYTGEADDRDSASRALCSQCKSPLHRVSEVSCYARFNVFASCRTKECTVCNDTILDGELHFVCDSCELPVCKSCGPGTSIDRDYDFVDVAAEEQVIKQMSDKVIHKRAKPGRTREVGQAMSAAQRIAQGVVAGARDLMQLIREEEHDIFDKDWVPHDGSSPLVRLFGGPSMDPNAVAENLMTVVKAAESILHEQPILSEVAVPCKVFGDVHGQLRDLLILLDRFGTPGDGPSFVWNGDFVDRGQHQVEVVGLLLALKVAHPEVVWLNRGNHEDAVMNDKYGFRKACSEALGPRGEEIYVAIQFVFGWLPLGSLIGNRILVVHGGVGDGNWSLEQLRGVQRPLGHKQLQSADWIWNILWSDPIEEDCNQGSMFGVHESPRGKAAKRFGWNITQQFCAKEGLDMVVRSHQAKKDGFGFDVMHDDCLMRVFSARDYERNGNDAAVLNVALADGEEFGGLLSVRAQVLRSLTKSASGR